jgi:hypothetical protein
MCALVASAKPEGRGKIGSAHSAGKFAGNGKKVKNMRKSPAGKNAYVSEGEKGGCAYVQMQFIFRRTVKRPPADQPITNRWSRCNASIVGTSLPPHYTRTKDGTARALSIA